jgi:hypothetical protein
VLKVFSFLLSKHFSTHYCSIHALQNNVNAIRGAIREGHLDVVKYLVEEGGVFKNARIGASANDHISKFYHITIIAFVYCIHSQ